MILYPGLRFYLISSIYNTVALSHSRFCATNNPIIHRNTMNSPSDRMKYFRRYIIPIAIFAAIIAIPAIWEHEITNTLNNATGPYIIASGLRQNPYYSMFYVGFLSLGLNGILPFSLLVYFTITITRGIHRNEYRAPSRTNPRERVNIVFNQTRDPTLVVNLIILLFLVFHSLRLGLTVVEFSMQLYKLKNKVYAIGCNGAFWLNILSAISDLFLCVNSSINTIIYNVVFWRSGSSEDPRPNPNNQSQMIPFVEIQRSVDRVETDNSARASIIPSDITVPMERNTTTTFVNVINSAPQVVTELNHGSDYDDL